MRPIPNFSRAYRNKQVRSRYKGLKQNPRAPLLKTVAPAVHRIIFGKNKLFRNEAALNRYKLKERFLGELVQQNQFESILDINPANRFQNHSSPIYTTRRYDGKPGDMISITEKPGSVIAATAKSCLTEKGQLLSVGNLPESVWTDDFPQSLAYLAYEHLNEMNKVKANAQLPEGATDEEKVGSKLDLIRKIEGELCNGSPITSTTTGNSLIENNLKTWGENNEYIEIDAHKTNVVSSQYIAAIVLFAAKNDDTKKNNDINKHKENNWRKRYLESNGTDMPKMANLLRQHGVDPDGKWTKRESSVYYALVADEHMLIGATPAGTARIVKS